MPLLDRDCADAAIAAWLRHLRADKAMPKLLLMPYLPDAGARAFDAAMAQHGGRSADFAAHQRALLAPQGDRAGYLDRVMAPKKRKELRRQRKRLGDLGAPAPHTATKAAEVAVALADFLALEAGGWKGRAGTAAQSDDALKSFVADAVHALAA